MAPAISRGSNDRQRSFEGDRRVPRGGASQAARERRPESKGENERRRKTKERKRERKKEARAYACISNERKIISTLHGTSFTRTSHPDDAIYARPAFKIADLSHLDTAKMHSNFNLIYEAIARG